MPSKRPQHRTKPPGRDSLPRTVTSTSLQTRKFKERDLGTGLAKSRVSERHLASAAPCLPVIARPWRVRFPAFPEGELNLLEIGLSRICPIPNLSVSCLSPDSVFLVRYMALKPAVLRPFESVAGELERAELNRLRHQTEKEFEDSVNAKYPAKRLDHPQTSPLTPGQ